MEQKYYWWVSYEKNYNYSHKEYVGTLHPFACRWKDQQVILNWREITREEYDLFNSK